MEWRKGKSGEIKVRKNRWKRDWIKWKNADEGREN